MQTRGIRIETLRKEQITAEVIEQMHEFYTNTVDKFRWGRRYLNRTFFFDICDRLADSVEIVLATNGGGRPIAGAFNLFGADALYGRYWGASEEHPFLHFNVCYYHSIEQCIERKNRAFRARRRGRAQANARLSPDADVQRAPPRRRATARRRRRLPGARARLHAARRERRGRGMN
jgi:predicted N-acyltransferase